MVNQLNLWLKKGIQADKEKGIDNYLNLKGKFA